MQQLSLRSYLIRLIWICVLPLLLLAFVLTAFSLWETGHDRDQEANQVAFNVAHTVDLAIKGHIDALRVLANSPSLDRPAGLADFYVEALAYSQSLHGHLVLADLEHNMLVNTRVPFGQPLPKLIPSEDHFAVPKALASGQPAVSNLFWGHVAQEHLIAIVVPVMRAGQAKYLMLGTLKAKQLGEHLAKISLSPGWSVEVLDNSQAVIAKSPSAEADQAQTTDHTRRFFAKSEIAPWQVVLHVPAVEYIHSFLVSLLVFLLVLAGLSLMSIWGGLQASRRLLKYVAIMLGDSQAGQGAVQRIKEFAKVGAELRQVEEERTLTAQILLMINTSTDRHSLLRSVLATLQAWSGCEAVGIRLQEGEDFPYYQTSGFPSSFVKLESSLCARGVGGEILRDANFDPVLECMCGNILRGRFDPSLPFFTPGGSFWSSCTSHLLATTSEAERQARTRNRCNGEGYESVALIPLRSGDQTFGLIQFNDKRTGCFTLEKITLLEKVANNISAYLAKAGAEEDLIKSEERYRLLVEAANEGILIAQDGWAKFFNPRLLEILDRTADEFAGSPFVEFIHPDDRTMVFGNYQRRIEGEDVPTGYAFRVLDGQGGVRWVSINSALVEWEGRPATLNLITDITQARQAEEDLRLWADAFQYCAHGIAIVMPDDNTILTCNPSFARMHSSSVPDIAGRPILSLYHPAEREVVKASIAQADRQGDVTYETYMIRDDSSKFPVQMDVVSVRGPGGETLYRVATMQDISGRRRAEEALRQSEERYRRIVETANEGIWGMDGDYRTTFVNSKMGDMLGYMPEEMLGQPVNNFMFPEDLADHGYKMQARQQGRSDTYERRFRAKNGSQVWTIVSATALIEEDGSFTGSFAMFTDISRRKLAEQELLRSQEALRGLLDATTDSVHLLDRDLKVIITNEVSAHRLGLGTDDIVGRCILDFFPPEVANRRRDILHEVLTTGCSRLLRDEREGHHFESHIFPVLDERGEVRSLAVYARDITKEVEAESQSKALTRQLQQSQKMEAIGILAGGIAHDFNNLLTSIIGFSEMARDDAKTGKADPRDIEQVLMAASRAKLLVKQILTFSRKVEADFKSLSLNNEVPQAIELLGKTIPKMITLQTDLAEDLWMVNADHTQIEQILLNLCINASDAIEGQGTIRIKTENRLVHEQPCFSCGKKFSGPYVVLEISDTGQGIDETTIEHIFEPFFTTKAVGKGTGLGLSTVYGIVLGHGGHISCKSFLGDGTTFTIFLPALEGGGDFVEIESPSVDDSGFHGRGRILLVDDEEVLLALGSRQLRKAGYEVETADSGEAALEAYREKGASLDLVILDLNMPGMGGYQALKELMSINHQVKAIIASGYAADEQIKASLAYGAVGYVAKPFNKTELLATVRSVLDKK